MPPLQFSVDVDDRDVEQVLGRINERISGSSFGRFLRGPGHSYFSERIGWNFEGEGSPWGGRWMPLSSATEDIRESLGYEPSHPINQRTKEMFRVLTEEADYTVTDESAEMSLPGKAGQRYPVNEKIRTAQLGRSQNPIPEFGPTPARPVLGMGEYDAERLLASLTVWITQDIASSF